MRVITVSIALVLAACSGDAVEDPHDLPDEDEVAELEQTCLAACDRALEARCESNLDSDCRNECRDSDLVEERCRPAVLAWHECGATTDHACVGYGTPRAVQCHREWEAMQACWNSAGPAGG